jgi:type IV secretory pathway VirB2 component (pilin)
MTSNKNIATGLLLSLAPLAVLTVEVAAYSAGTSTGTDALGSFDTLLTEIIGWIDGPLGTLLAVAALGVGLAMGVVQQSIMAAVTGIFFAAVVNYGPQILEGISGAADSAL